MAQGRYDILRDSVAGFDAKLRRLADLGIDLSRPAPALLADLRARREEMRRQHERLEAARRAADRQLLPELLALYVGGTDADRRFVRELLDRHRSFRWGFGWGLAARIATADGARNALAVLSMKDGGSDWRDQIVALDNICAAIRAAGLPLGEVLRQAAAWSSDVPRFPAAGSTRALLLRYAARFG